MRLEIGDWKKLKFHKRESQLNAISYLGPAIFFNPGRSVNWIQTSDILLAEVSVPSHGVGYEIGFALNLGKPVLCIHHAGRAVSKMITGNPDSLLRVKAYEDIQQALAQIDEFVKIVT